MAAVPDRQNLPVQTGKPFRSRQADFAGHSIEEYAFTNTHYKKTQYKTFENEFGTQDAQVKERLLDRTCRTLRNPTAFFKVHQKWLSRAPKKAGARIWLNRANFEASHKNEVSAVPMWHATTLTGPDGGIAETLLHETAGRELSLWGFDRSGRCGCRSRQLMRSAECGGQEKIDAIRCRL